MSLFTKYSADVLGWQTPPGPLRVWRVVEGRKKVDGKTLRFSIQQIPEDRYEDTLKLMTTVLAQDEPWCASLGLYNDPQGIAEFQKVWSFCLQQGIAVGAFLVDENNPKPVLAGANMIYMITAAAEEGMKREITMTSRTMEVIIKLMGDLEKEVNIRKYYNVDEYMSAYGLSVDRAYRGQGLGNHLLAVRDDIAAAYGIKATSTVFSCTPAQKAAANAGFETLIKRKYVDTRNEDGSEIFPGVEYEYYTLMGKRFS